MKDLTEQIVEIWKTEYPDQFEHFPRCYQWEEKMVQLNELDFKEPKELAKAKKYAQLIKEGVVFPPVIIINKNWVIDGLHRVWAYQENGIYEIKAFVGRTL